MSDIVKRTPSSPRKNLGTVPEQGENDAISIPTGTNVPSKHSSGAVLGKQTMQSSAPVDAFEKTSAHEGLLHPQLSRTFLQSRSSSYSSSVDLCSSPSRHRLGTVAVEDPITHEKVVNSKVLLLYTGGALGWKVDPQGNYLQRNFRRQNLQISTLAFELVYLLYHSTASPRTRLSKQRRIHGTRANDA